MIHIVTLGTYVCLYDILENMSNKDAQKFISKNKVIPKSDVELNRILPLSDRDDITWDLPTVGINRAMNETLISKRPVKLRRTRFKDTRDGKMYVECKDMYVGPADVFEVKNPNNLGGSLKDIK